jgi:hypothetical protein
MLCFVLFVRSTLIPALVHDHPHTHTHARRGRLRTKNRRSKRASFNLSIWYVKISYCSVRTPVVLFMRPSPDVTLTPNAACMQQESPIARAQSNGERVGVVGAGGCGGGVGQGGVGGCGGGTTGVGHGSYKPKGELPVNVYFVHVRTVFDQLY